MDGREPQTERRGAWSRGLSDGLTQAIELVATPVLCGIVGALVDSWIGTTRLFTLTFAFVALIGAGLAVYYRYQAAMDAQDEGRPWARKAQR